jgi:hypothetical protein
MAISADQVNYRYYTSERSANSQITIRSDGTGGIIVDKPSSDNVRGGSHIAWWVVNETNDPHVVTVTNFRVKATGQLEWPFDNPESDGTVRALPGASRIKLKTKDRGPNDKKGTWVYTYDVVVDGVPREPEIVVEWPI